MKRLLSTGVMVSLLAAGISLSWAETTVKGSKSNTSDRVAGSGEAKPTAAPATQDPCANVKNDPNQYAKCQDATKPAGLPKRSGGKQGY